MTFDKKLLDLVQSAIPSLEAWSYVGLGLNRTEMSLVRTARVEQNWEAHDFILAHSGWNRPMPQVTITNRHPK